MKINVAVYLVDKYENSGKRITVTAIIKKVGGNWFQNKQNTTDPKLKFPFGMASTPSYYQIT